MKAPKQILVATENMGQLKFELNEVKEIGFGKLPARKLKTWMATLADGSTLVVDPLQDFKSNLLEAICQN